MLLSSHTAARPRHSLSVQGAALRADPLYAAFDEPKFYAEAMRSSDADKWREAMDEEIAVFWWNGAWELVDIWNILTAKRVFKRKRDTDNIIQRFRARRVARGFQQRDGIDYGEIFSPVVRYTTLLMLLAHYGLFSNATWTAPRRSHKLTWTLRAT
jgi:hypothetical protein